jgi:hypothetical protein
MPPHPDSSQVSHTDPRHGANVSSDDGWNAFEAVVHLVAEVLTSTSQLSLIYHASHSTGGPVFVLLCISKPILRALTQRDHWSSGFIVHINNPHYQRMEALLKLSGNAYRQDYIAGGIANHILDEYEKASQNLGDTNTDDWWRQFRRTPSPYFDTLCDVIGDLPMVGPPAGGSSLLTSSRPTARSMPLPIH